MVRRTIQVVVTAATVPVADAQIRAWTVTTVSVPGATIIVVEGALVAMGGTVRTVFMTCCDGMFCRRECCSSCVANGDPWFDLRKEGMRCPKCIVKEPCSKCKKVMEEGCLGQCHACSSENAAVILCSDCGSRCESCEKVWCNECPSCACKNRARDDVDKIIDEAVQSARVEIARQIDSTVEGRSANQDLRETMTALSESFLSTMHKEMSSAFNKFISKDSPAAK